MGSVSDNRASSTDDSIITYTYDAVGNRTAHNSTLDGITDQAFSFSANDQLESDDYDLNGNTIGTGGHVDVYDYRNKLIRRTKASGEVIDVSYDAYGDRYAKRVNGVETQYLVDRNNLTGYSQVVEELATDAFGSLTMEMAYTYGHDLISQRDAAGTASYYHYDGLGTVRALSDESGQVTDAYFYDAYGVLLHRAGQSTENAYLYTGEQFDADLGMYFLRARYLDPDKGRFHTLDSYEGTRADPQTLHKYLYAHGNPVMGRDPSGRWTLVDVLVAAVSITIIANIGAATIYTRARNTKDSECVDKCVANYKASIHMLNEYIEEAYLSWLYAAEVIWDRIAQMYEYSMKGTCDLFSDPILRRTCRHINMVVYAAAFGLEVGIGEAFALAQLPVWWYGGFTGCNLTLAACLLECPQKH